MNSRHPSSWEGRRGKRAEGKTRAEESGEQARGYRTTARFDRALLWSSVFIHLSRQGNRGGRLTQDKPHPIRSVILLPHPFCVVRAQAPGYHAEGRQVLQQLSLVVCDLLQGLDGQEPSRAKANLASPGMASNSLYAASAPRTSLWGGVPNLFLLSSAVSLASAGIKKGDLDPEQGREGECLVSQSQRATVDHQFTQPRIRWQLREQLAQRGDAHRRLRARRYTADPLPRCAPPRVEGFGKPGAHRLGVTFEVESLDPHNQLLQVHAPHLWVCVPVHSLERVRGEEVESNTGSDASSATTPLLAAAADTATSSRELMRVSPRRISPPSRVRCR